jgi:hypothetical protein
MGVTSTALRTQFIEDRIAPPGDSKEPLKVNVFHHMAGANCQLLPLFPYLGPGAIVPCGAIFTGAPGAQFGHFFHYNTEHEVVLTFAGNKAMMATGQVYATQPLHGVNSFLRSPEDPEAFLILTITQRQQEEREQKEAVIVRCQNCHAELVRLEFEAMSTSASTGDSDAIEPFLTIIRTDEATVLLEAQRTCAKCGTVAEAFPRETWGWQRYAAQIRTVNVGRRTLNERASLVHQETSAT